MGKINSNERFDWYNQVGAMKNDLIRALIELITNSNEAYMKEDGAIDVILDNSKKGELFVEVRDYAKGISDIKASLIRGETTAGIHNNSQSRGRHGRGMKDVPILAVDNTFKISTVNRENKNYYEVKFVDHANYQGEEENLNDPKPVPQDCKFQNGGTSIEFEVKPTVTPRRPELIKSKLQTHIELRDILKERNVNFIVNGTEEKLECIHNVDEAELLDKGEINIPEFKKYIKNYGKVNYKIYKLKKPTTSKIDEYSHAGILIKGNGINYDNEDFGKKDYAEMFHIHGIIDIPFIDELYLEFDKNRDIPIELNPMSIITTTRDGLEKNTLYICQLRKLLYLSLINLFIKLEKKKKIKTIQKAKSKNASKLFSQIAKNLHLLGDDDSDTEVLLEFRPPLVKIHKDDRKVASIVADIKKFNIGDEVTFKVSSGENIKILQTTKELTQHKTNSNLLSTTIEIEGLDYGEAVVTAKCGKLKAFNNLNIEVVSKPEPKK